MQHQQSPLVRWGDITVHEGRVVQSTKGDQGAVVRCLHLDMLHGTTVEQQQHLLFLLGGLTIGLMTYLAADVLPSGWGLYGGILAVALLVLFVGTRRTTLVLAAGSSTITSAVKGGKAGLRQALEFAARVDAAALRSRQQQRQASVTPAPHYTAPPSQGIGA